MRFGVLILGLLWICATPGFAVEVEKEEFARGTSSASEAFAQFKVKRLGILLVATEKRPDLGFNYSGRALLTEVRDLPQDAFRMSQQYELALYEAVRNVFFEAGFQARSLNREPWERMELKEVLSQAKEVDAVCVVHYNIHRTYKIWDRDGYGWSSPFQGMLLEVRLRTFDAASQDLIYGLELRALGTEELYSALGEMVVEEPLYPGGSDEHGTPNAYKIAVYQAAIHDLRTGKLPIPLIRTAKGSLDISYVGGWAATDGKYKMEHEMLRLNIPVSDDVANENSVLARMLEYVPYRPRPEDVEYFDLKGIHHCGQMLKEKLR
ncbi:MAG: hypothetical protein O2954_15745 [bacterium]|nr:hypothetical protein [bacterium]